MKVLCNRRFFNYDTPTSFLRFFNRESDSGEFFVTFRVILY